jgi:hypothetical protein
MIVLADFVDDVMRELVVALGGALFLGNLLALLRHRAAATGDSEGEETDDSATAVRAPVLRTVVFLLLGFVVMVWGIASLAVS